MASLDLNILRALSTRDRFRSLRGAVPNDMLDPNTSALLGWFDLYFKTYDDHVLLDPASLMTLIRLRSSLEGPALQVMEQIVQRLGEPIDASTLKTTVQTLEELRMSGEAAAIISAYQRGEEVDLAYELQQLAHRTKQRIERTGAAKWADEDPLVYIEREADESGLQLDIFPQLAANLKGLRAGHNIAVGAPTDAGKTSLLCRIAVCMAEQAKTVYPDQPLLYLLNEGTAEGITPRVYQTVLQCNFNEMLHLARAGELVPKYEQVVGRRDAIRLVNVHGMKLSQVARIIEAHNPYMVITDMTGRICANSNTAGGKNDTSQVEEVWNSMRELAAIQQFIHLGTVQVSAEGFNMLFPPLSALQDSKVGIQTTLDLALIMGRLNAPEMETLRGLSTPKNKLARSGRRGMNQFEVYFDPTTNTWDAGQVAVAPGG